MEISSRLNNLRRDMVNDYLNNEEQQKEFIEITNQIKELEKTSVVIANVMSSRLRREIEKAYKYEWKCEIDQILAKYMLDTLSEAISCEEISET